MTLDFIAQAERGLRLEPNEATGTGAQVGPMRPDWGDGWADLECDECGAGWVGPVGEHCAYCVRSLELMRGWQADLLLRAPLPDVDDDRRLHAMTAWAQRLKVGIGAGLITSTQANTAWRREVRRHDDE